jgi:signal transduction histidine kinase
LLLNQQGTSARQIRFSIAHTQDLLADVTGLNILIRDAESAQRGYVLTGAPDYLASYEAALQHLPALYEHLRYLVADDPRQQHELVALRSIIQQKLAEMTQIIQLRTNSGEDAARSVVATDIGRFLMSQISEIMSAIAAEDGRQIVERVSAIEQADARVRQLAAFGSGLAVLLLALAGLAVSRGAARRHRLEQRIAQQRRGDLERSNTDLARQTAALERSNAELGDFAQIASHDLKGPLRGPSNNARFLHEDYAKKLDRDGVGRLLRLGYLCQRMERLIDDLLHFSRLGRQELGGKVTDLNAVIRDIEPMSETTLKECNASIVIPQELPRIGCDSVRITEVFCNLIVNAIKYNESTAKLIEIGYFNELKTGGATEEQVFYVKDNGIGVAEVFHEDIFRIFMRINAEDDDKKGIGVGLTFVRKIVERHGGRIWLDSALGKGATVYFTIAQGTAYAP